MKFDRLSIVLSTHAAQFEAVAFKGEIETNLAQIARWGYEGVELAIRDPAIVDLNQLVTLLTSYRLQVPAIGTGQAWSEEHLSLTSPDRVIREAAIARIKSHIEMAQNLNALVIIGLIRGVTPPGQAKAQSMRYLIEGLQECVEKARACQVRLAFEPINRYETDLIHNAQESQDLIEEIDSPNLGLLLDTFHMNIEEGDICESILRTSKHIFHFHVADSNRLYPGAGHLDFKSILGELISTGYTGWISGEFMPIPDAGTAAQRGLLHLQNLLA